MNKNIIQLDKFIQIIIIDISSSINNEQYNSINSYNRIIEILEYLNLIIIKNNKLKWIGNNTCIVYNLHTLDKTNISKIKTLFNFLKEQITKTNSAILFLHKNSNKIYKIGNNIILHSNIIKTILKNHNLDNLLSMINLDQLYNIINELIRISVLKMVDNLDININNHMEKYINKNSLHLKKQNSIHYLNKLCFINNYKNNNKKLYCIGEKQKGIYRIINDNQIIIM